MTDPRQFEAPYNPAERIWQEADRIRTPRLTDRPPDVKVLALVFTYSLSLVSHSRTGSARTQLPAVAPLWHYHRPTP